MPMRVVVCLGLLLSVSLRAQDRVASLDLPARDEVRVIVELRDEPSPRLAATAARPRALGRLRADVERTGARVRHEFSIVLSGLSATVRPDELEAIRALPNVARVVETRRVRATLASSVAATGADRVWQSYGTRGAGTVVAVIDTGIDMQHEAFGQRIIGGWDFINGDADADDDNGHGTHVAGIVAANGGGLVGVAPDAKLLAYKVLDHNGSGDSSDLIAAIERALDPNGDGDLSDRADVINMSLSGPGPEDDPLVTAVDRAVAAGSVVVVSAGNTGRYYDMGIPSAAPAAITVGAIGRDNALAPFSTRGPTKELLTAKPEIVAQGVDIVSAKRDGGTIAATGTSMAAPHVAGVAALLRAIRPEATPAEIKAAMVSTAVPVADDVMAAGAGRLDAHAAAQQSVFPWPAVVSFGRTSGVPAQWTATATVSLTNRSAQARTFTVTKTTGERSGVAITVSPASVRLAPGETQQVTLRLDVDHTRVPSPTMGSLSFGGAVTFSSGTVSARVPWVFIKAAKISLQWKSDTAFDGLIVGRDVSRLIGATSPRMITTLLPPGAYDIVIASRTARQEPLLLVKEQIDAAGDPEIVASVRDANHTLTLASVDETGEPLALAGNIRCQRHVVFDFPDGRGIDLLRIPFEAQRIFVSDVHLLRTLSFEQCSDASRGAIFAAEYDVPLPLTENVTLRNAPSDYASNPVQIPVPATVEAPTVLLYGGLETRTAGGNYFYGGPIRGTATRPVWRGTIFTMPTVHEDVSGSAIAGIGSGTRLDGIMSQPLHRDGDRLVSSRGITPTPNDFSVPLGEAVTIGTGPLFPMAATVAGGDRFFSSFVEWRGLQGETYRFDVSNESYELYDASGALLRTQTQMCCAGVTPGAYRVVGRASLRSDGIAHESTLITNVDTRREDHVPPAMTALRFVDGDGAIARRVGEGAAMFFSAYDLYSDARLYTYTQPLPAETVRVEWRRNGTAEWIAAAAVIVSEDHADYEASGHPATGTHFRVDLADAVRTGGVMDVRIRFADASGNSSEWIGERAFVAGSGRRRAARR